MKIEAQNNELNFNNKQPSIEIEVQSENDNKIDVNFGNSNINIIFQETKSNDINFETPFTSPYPPLENLEIMPTEEEQNFKSKKYGFNEVKVNPIPNKYVIPKVIGKTLILSRVNVEEGGLIL